MTETVLKRTATAAVTIWYDSACPICAREIRLMRALDWGRRVDFVDIYASDQACPLDRNQLLDRFHARDGDGTIVSGAAAFALMWREIPIFWPLGQMARLNFVSKILDRAYGHFLLWRGR